MDDAPIRARGLTLEQTLGQGERVDFTGELPGYAWASDGVHLVFTEKEHKVWIDPASWQESAPPAETEKKDDGVAGALVAAGVAKEAVEKLFDVKVVKVATMNRKGKYRRTRFRMGKTADWKKAVVTLHEDNRIDFF